MPVAAENALEIDLVDLALHPARKSRQRVFKAARGRIERLEFVALISRESRVRDREKETLVRETCVRVPLFRACVCFPFSLSLPFPRLSLLLVYLSCLSLSLSLSLSLLSLGLPRSASVSLQHFLSLGDKPSANVLDGRCSDGGSATRRCMSLRLCATSTLFSSLYLSLSLVISFSFSLNAHRKSRATLHFTTARGCCRAHITSSTPSLRSRCPSATTRSLDSRRSSACVRVPVHRDLQLELALLVSRSLLEFNFLVNY